MINAVSASSTQLHIVEEVFRPFSEVKVVSPGLKNNNSNRNNNSNNSGYDIVVVDNYLVHYTV